MIWGGKKMFEFLEELFGNGMEEPAAGTEGTAAAGLEGTEMPNESPAGTMEQTGGGFYIKNGILYNGSIDTMLTDLSRDMAENHPQRVLGTGLPVADVRASGADRGDGGSEPGKF